jgi:dUTP pyrophosphatase
MVGLCLEGGVIDATYRGEVKLILWNRDPRSTIKIFKGDYIAQMVIHKIFTGGIFEEVKELFTTTKGT